MKKYLLSLAVCILTLLILIPFSALAGETTMEAPVLNSPTLKEANKAYLIEVTYPIPDNIKSLNASNRAAVHVQAEVRVNGGAWKQLSTNFNLDGNYKITPKDVSTGAIIDIKAAQYETRARFAYNRTGEQFSAYSEFSPIVSIGTPAFYSDTSAWAKPDMDKAANMGLIPDCLKGADMTKSITRAEFAAVAVKLYESLSGQKAVPIAQNPFTDTTDAEVLKAYNLSIVSGVGGNKFEPNTLLDREQAAAMLTRVYKKVNWEGWTLKDEATYTKYKLDYAGVPAFSDDMNISDWAKPSVYFMAKNNIIKGIGGNSFAPKNITPAEVATGYANATREVALVIAVHTVENLK
ncbi:MAG TPA: S-layer homology domain-containing protein [Syntrophomonadaceae bacterium]|nr:S-layer homology domain-containing protein [Syntrophomonadaceae bacterium]